MSELPEPDGIAKQPFFFPVGLRKFALMQRATFGLYQLHWFYENWWLVKTRRKTRLRPGARALFAAFFAWPLFREIRRAADEDRIPTAFSPAGAAITYLLGGIAALVLIDALWPLALLLLYVPLHLAQRVAIQVNTVRSPGADRNEKLTSVNRVALLVVGFFFLLALLSSCLELSGT